MQEPNTASLLLAINVLQDLHNIIPLCIDLATLGDLHVHVLFDWFLEIGQNIVDLEGLPAIYDGQDQDGPDDDPVCHRCIGFVVVPAKDLARAV